MKKFIQTDKVYKPPANYSQAIQAGPFVFCAGQVALDASGKIVGTDIETQTRQVIENLQTILAAAGYKLEDIIKINAYLADMGDWPGFNQVFNEVFKTGPPVRTTVAISFLPELKLEIEAVAYKG